MEATPRHEVENEEVRSRLAATIEKAKDICQKLEEQTVTAAKATDKVVREHPYQAMGIAFGAGLLVGLLVARSRD